MEKIISALQNTDKPLSRGSYVKLSNLTRDEILKIDPNFPENVVRYPKLNIGLFYRIAQQFGMNNVDILWSLRTRIRYSEWIARIPLSGQIELINLARRFTLIMINEETNFSNFEFLISQIKGSNITAEIVNLVEQFINENPEQTPNFYMGLILQVIERAGVNRGAFEDNGELLGRIDDLANNANEGYRRRWFEGTS